MKQIRILKHHPDLPAIVSRVEAPEVDAVDPDRSPGRVVEARDQVYDRRLATARRADQTDQLARMDVEAHGAQHLPHTVVPERHVLERHPSMHRLEPDRRRDVAHFGLRVQYLEYAMRGRGRSIDGARHLADHFDRRSEHRGVEQERDKRSDRQLRAVTKQPRHGKHPDHDRHHVHAEHEQRPECGPRRVNTVELRRHVLVALAEAPDLALLLVEGLDHADARDRVRQDICHA